MVLAGLSSGSTCQSSLMPMPNCWGSRSFDRSNLAMSCLASEPRTPSPISMYLPSSSMAAGCSSSRSPFFSVPVACGDADDGTLVVMKHFGCGKARIDLDAQRFCVARQPATDVAERDDVIALIIPQGRHHKVRQANGAGRTEHQKVVGRHFRLEGMALLLAPAGKQAVDADRIDDGAGEDMGADFRALFQDDHGEVRIDLLQPDRRRQAAGSRADDHHENFMLSRSGISVMPIAFPRPIKVSARLGRLNAARR